MGIEVVRGLSRLLVPVACPGCGAAEVPLCLTCVAPLLGGPRRVEADAPRLDRLDAPGPMPVWATAVYVGPLRDVVVAWKDRGRADLDARLGAAARQAGRRLAGILGAAAGNLPTDGPTGPVPGPTDGPTGPVPGPTGGPGPARPARSSRRGPAPSMVAVVPAPSTRAALRARGRDPVRVLAVAFARGLELGGVPARVTPVLRQVRSRDQVGLGSRARGGRLDTIRRRRRVPLRGLAHVLVDDVLTSGATLAAAENELIRAGIPVLGGYVLAATPAPRRPRGP